jgi:hypothetical protein
MECFIEALLHGDFFSSILASLQVFHSRELFCGRVVFLNAVNCIRSGQGMIQFATRLDDSSCEATGQSLP